MQTYHLCFNTNISLPPEGENFLSFLKTHKCEYNSFTDLTVVCTNEEVLILKLQLPSLIISPINQDQINI
jgi:hypothetical protein